LFSYLMNFIYLYLYVHVDVIVDITPQLITLNQRSKSDKYHKNNHSSVLLGPCFVAEGPAKRNSFN
jgi:hypothetical protein